MEGRKIFKDMSGVDLHRFQKVLQDSLKLLSKNAISFQLEEKEAVLDYKEQLQTFIYDLEEEIKYRSHVKKEKKQQEAAFFRELLNEEADGIQKELESDPEWGKHPAPARIKEYLDKAIAEQE